MGVFAPPPPSASPCTERSSYLLVSWLLASFSTRWQSSTVLCQLLVCTTALLEHELSIQPVGSAHDSFQKILVGISNSQGDPIQPRDCMEKKPKRNIYLRKSEKKKKT